MTSLAVYVALVLALSGTQAGAAAKNAGLDVRDAWVRQTSATRTVSSGYFRIDNRSGTPVALVRVDVEGARNAELHAVVEDNGRTIMKPLARLTVPARGSVTLEPGGTHLMVTGVTRPFRTGSLVRMTLIFDNRQTRIVQAVVRPLDATSVR